MSSQTDIYRAAYKLVEAIGQLADLASELETALNNAYAEQAIEEAEDKEQGNE